MRRLAVCLMIRGRLMMSGTVLVASAALAGCSGSAALAYAHGADGSATGSSRASATATVRAKVRATASPAVPELRVAGVPQRVRAKAGILVDASTGQVLWARGPGTERPIASITKVMTALVILRAGGLNRKVTVPKAVTGYVAEHDAEAAGLVPGQVFTVDQLLHGMLIESAADAAYTLAVAYGPGLRAFVAKMNATAAAMGLRHTHFTSPDGLPYPTETSTYSTPAELVSLGEAAMRYPQFRSIVDMRYYSLPKDGSHSAYFFTTTDELIGRYRGVVGIKTGYTDDAGHTLLFEAVRGGRVLIGDVLGSPATGPASGAQDAAKVLNWGFSLKQAG